MLHGYFITAYENYIYNENYDTCNLIDMEHVSSKRDRSDDFEEEKEKRQRIFEEIFEEDLADEAEQENDEAEQENPARAERLKRAQQQKARTLRRIRAAQQQQDAIGLIALKQVENRIAEKAYYQKRAARDRRIQAAKEQKRQTKQRIYDKHRQKVYDDYLEYREQQAPRKYIPRLNDWRRRGTRYRERVVIIPSRYEDQEEYFFGNIYK